MSAKLMQIAEKRTKILKNLWENGKMTLFNIRKEDLDMLKRKIDRYLADWSNEQDRNSDLNIACR